MIWGEGGGCLFCLHMQNTLWVLTQRLAKATSMLMQIQLKPHPFLYVEMAFLSKTEMYIFFYYVFFLITWPIRLKTWFSYCSRRSACYPGRVFKHARRKRRGPLHKRILRYYTSRIIAIPSSSARPRGIVSVHHSNLQNEPNLPERADGNENRRAGFSSEYFVNGNVIYSTV